VLVADDGTRSRDGHETAQGKGSDNIWVNGKAVESHYGLSDLTVGVTDFMQLSRFGSCDCDW